MSLLSAEARERIHPFVTSTTRSIYCLKNLPEEVVAVLFAYYSRSRESLRENLLKLVQEDDLDLGSSAALGSEDAEAAEARHFSEAREKARAFHEKWVVGYGHSSVAEHAVVHVAVEDISILASKVIEDARLASFTEKSTRYVPFDTTRYHVPAAFMGRPAEAVFQAGVEAVMSAYRDLMEPLVRHLAAAIPPRPGQTERGHQSACRAQACDILRYLLPAATHTNLGMTANARTLEALLSKMFSHPLEEVRQAGEAIREEALRIVPTLIKYAARSEYRSGIETQLRKAAAGMLAAETGREGMEDRFPVAAILEDDGSPTVRLIRHDADAEARVLEAMLFAASERPAGDIQKAVAELNAANRQLLFDAYLSGRGSHDQPLRALEETHYTFEIVTDYGAYRDIQRHRMAGQYPQRLSVDLGYSRPAELEAAGMLTRFEEAMNAAARACRSLSGEHPDEAQYVVPLAFRKRFLLSMNLREVFHFVQLRSARQGHPSYRRVAQEVHREVARVHPGLAAFMRVDLADYALSRS